MAYIVVENFSAGLDTRRHPLTSKSGTLQTLKNAHVSRGGEIEKRKAFVNFASLPANTFGMEATSSTIYVFGSDAGVVVPAGVTYQRLQHPDASAMTEVVYSTLYGGFPFVIAKFADGKVYPFWNGTIISDFVDGITRSSIGSLANLIGQFQNIVINSNTGYSALNGLSYLDVTGPPGVTYTPSAIAESPITVTTSIISQPQAAVTEVLSSGSFRVNGGSPSVKASGGATMRYIGATPGITGIFVGGREILKLAAGTQIDYTSQPSGATYYDSGQRLAYTIAYYINQATSLNTGFTAAYSYFGGGWSGNDPGGFTIYSPATNPVSYNGQEIWVEFESSPSGFGSIAELIDTTTIIVSPHSQNTVPPSSSVNRYLARLSQSYVLSGGVTSALSSVKVDGVEVLGVPVQWTLSNSDTMAAIVSQINTYTSTPEYTASLGDNSVVLKGLAGTGSSPNFRQITIATTGTVTAIVLPDAFGSPQMNGGRNAASATGQKTFYFFGGTYANDKTVTLIATPTLDPANPIYWGATRVSKTTPVSALTFKTKAHLTSSSSLFFSGVNQPTKWGEMGIGSGFINMSNNSGGNEVLTALALYQGNLAAFARRSVQIWSIDTDPANNRQGQVLSNTGTVSANSVVSVGDIDVFYLSDSGVRSLRARDSSNSAVVNDVGTPIDNLVLADLEPLTDEQKRACCSVIEPIDGRYWIAIGSKVYVYSYFPNSSVAAWSTYEPGFTITKFTTKDGRVYARAGNVIYLYGGASGSEYDSSEVEVILPYLDGGKPAHQKALNGLDMTVQGTWQIFIGMDPIAPTARDNCGTITQPTFSLGRIMANGTGTHVGIRMLNSSAGYARIANIIAHFEANESN
jgi:hypothetical protein